MIHDASTAVVNTLDPDYAREHGIDPQVEGRIEIRNREDIADERR